MAKVAPSPVERVRGEPPADASWRADALAGSRHTRWIDELREPLDDPDPEKAVRLCAEVTRAALRDFAPALILLSPSERRRAQALAAHALVMFDFACQSGFEGERLSHLNRVEFDLENALDGSPRGQPVFVALAEAAKERPWPREGLDRLAASARRRVAQPRPASDRESEVEARELAAAIVLCLCGEEPRALTDLGAAALRLHGLLGLGDGLRRQRPRLSEEALPDDWMATVDRNPALGSAIERECRQVRILLADAPTPQGPASVRRAARYLRLATTRLLARAEALGSDLVDHRPGLGASRRIVLLLRARLAL